MVAADTAATARSAANLVQVQATALPLELDVHRAAGRAERVVHRAQARRGATGTALKAGAHQVRVAVETRGSDPLMVEPEAALAVPLEGERYRVYASGLDLFHDSSNSSVPSRDSIPMPWNWSTCPSVGQAVPGST